MLKRIWRLFVAIISLGLVRLENKNAGAVRNQIIDEKVGQVAQAKRGLGELAGAVRAQTREVARLEGESKTLVGRKAHFLGLVQSAVPNSPEATEAKESALGYHRQNAEVISDLNAARTELTRLTDEYEISKGLVTQAQVDVRDAKKKGARQDQRVKAARRREQLVQTTSSLRGVSGIGDDLATLDEQIETEIDNLEGAAYVAADLASGELKAGSARARRESECAERVDSGPGARSGPGIQWGGGLRFFRLWFFRFRLF
jgi:hypothetical protein